MDGERDSKNEIGRPSNEICSDDMLQFSLLAFSVLPADVFMGLSREGIPAEGEKKIVEKKEMN